MRASDDVIYQGRSDVAANGRLQPTKRSPLGPQDQFKPITDFKALSLNKSHPLSTLKGVPSLGKITCMTSLGYTGFIIGGTDGRLCVVSFASAAKGEGGREDLFSKDEIFTKP